MTDPDAQRGPGVVALSHDERGVFDRALRKARLAAFPPGKFVGQESFMKASDILRLAERAGIGAATSVLDVCCGVGGPGLLIVRELGCAYRGVDASPAAVRIARIRAGNLNCRFDAAPIPPLPPGPFDVVLLLETMLAFPDKRSLLYDVSEALPVGGRFAFTVEAGQSLSEAEQELMPDSSTVWPVPLPDMLAHLVAAGLRVTWMEDCSRAHQTVAKRLHREFAADAKSISAGIGDAGLESLLAAHRLWIDWLARGRVRKFMFVAERAARSPKHS